MNSFARWQTVILAVALVASFSACVFACPTCSEGLGEADAQYQSIAAGFNYSILFMMSMPYVILGSFGCLAYLSIRRAKDRQSAVENDDRQLPS